MGAKSEGRDRFTKGALVDVTSHEASTKLPHCCPWVVQVVIGQYGSKDLVVPKQVDLAAVTDHRKT